MHHYLDEWSNNTVGDILRYMDTVDAQLANAANDEEARRIVAAAFPSPSEMAGTVSSAKGSVGLVGVGIEDILNAGPVMAHTMSNDTPFQRWLAAGNNRLPACLIAAALLVAVAEWLVGPRSSLIDFVSPGRSSRCSCSGASETATPLLLLVGWHLRTVGGGRGFTPG